MLRSTTKILKILNFSKVKAPYSSGISAEAQEDLTWFAEQPLCKKVNPPSHEENLRWMYDQMKKIEGPEDYTVLDTTGFAKAYEDAKERCIPSGYY